MRTLFILIGMLMVASCMPPQKTLTKLDASSFEGNWFGIRPEGVTTLLSDGTFSADGTVVVRFYTCLSSRAESSQTDHGTWSFDNHILTITLSESSEGDSLEPYSYDYSVLTDDFDRRTMANETSGYDFWLHRRWHSQPYDCSTDKQEIERDRNAAIADGRFRAIYPDYSGP